MKLAESWEYYIFVNTCDIVIFGGKIIGPKFELVEAALKFFGFDDHRDLLVFQKPELGQLIPYAEIGRNNVFRPVKVLEKLWPELDAQEYYNTYFPFIKIN